MKKKFRDIIVGGIQYAWQVKDKINNQELTIWKDKQIILKNYYSKYTAVSGEMIIITPKTISEIIKSITINL